MRIPAPRKTFALFLFLSLAVGLWLVLRGSDSEKEAEKTQLHRLPKNKPARQVQTVRPKAQLCPNFRTICTRKRRRRDPTGLGVKDSPIELAALRRYRRIVHAHPALTMEQIDELFVQQTYPPKARKRLFTLFDWVKRTLLTLLDAKLAQNLEAKQLQKLKASVSQVELELPPPASVYQNDRDILTRPVVLYKSPAEKRSARIRVGGAYPIRTLSFYQIVFTLAHELAHSIDPCEVKMAQLESSFHQTLSQCFLKVGWLPQESHLQCGKNSHLAEVFADFIATEVTSVALLRFGKSYLEKEKWASARNSVGDLCGLSDAQYELDFSNHPKPKVRIEGIFASHPKLRSFLACGKSVPYCSFSGRYIP